MNAKVATFRPRVDIEEKIERAYNDGYADGEKCFKEMCIKQFWRGLICGLSFSIVIVGLTLWLA